MRLPHLAILFLLITFWTSSCTKKSSSTVKPIIPPASTNSAYRVDTVYGNFSLESKMDVYDVFNKTPTVYTISYYPDSTITIGGHEYTLIDHFDFQKGTGTPFSMAVNYHWARNNTGQYLTGKDNKTVTVNMRNDSLIITGYDAQYCGTEIEVDTFSGKVVVQ